MASSDHPRRTEVIESSETEIEMSLTTSSGIDTERVIAAPPRAPRVASLRSLLLEATGHLPLCLALAAIVVIGSVGSSQFLTSNNLFNLAQQAAALGVVAVGTTALMIAGGIDLSVGSTVSLCSILVARTINDGQPLVAVVAEAVMLGAAVGMVLGVIITVTKASAFMVTLGALSIIAGGAAWMTNNNPILVTRPFATLGVSRWHGIPISALVTVVVALLLYALLHHLRLGRLIFAVGGNAEAARLAGIRVGLVRIAVYTINSALCGLAAAMLVSRVGSGASDLGLNMELQVIAAVVIGGALLEGGAGSLLGSLLGVVLLTAITNMLNLVGASSYFSDIFTGGVIVVAMVLRADRARALGRALKELLPLRAFRPHHQEDSQP